MSNLGNTKNLYILVGENGVSGVYTTKKLAGESASADNGDVLHVVPVRFLNTYLELSNYSPPSLPTLTYSPGIPSEVVSDGEEYDEDDVLYDADPEAYEAALAMQVAQESHEEYQKETSRVPQPVTAKQRILAKLQADLGLDDEEVVQPSGGKVTYVEGGLSGGGTAAQVEVFSPL